MTIIIIVVLLALIFDFINGFHDTANAIATSVSTKALTPRTAIMYAAVLNFVGAIIFEGVAKNVGGSIADPFQIENGLQIVIAALISAIAWNLITWYFGIPSSSSHTLIGSLAGAVFAGAGLDAINWSGFNKIIIILILSPVIAFVVGYIVLNIIRWLIYLLGNRSPSKVNRSFRLMQIVSAGAQAFSHGANDAQKAMGIIVFALIAGDFQTELHVPFWVKAAAATAMGLGTAFGGMKIIKTVSKKIIKIEPMNGFASDLTSTLVLQTATHYGMPLSTTHVITSAIIGTGSAVRFRSINWGTVGQMIMTWVITIPISMVLAFVIYKLMMMLF
ncbi:inorganic phosphate transporter [Paenibacillus sp. J2TS4]|uniref:inorganic phosphate transporter n=1 Tax=Paenibacillus sp. J2TS4 TaxID=2807194 RepID=UPI001B240B36|nr:inorganic phosphate transporter [Paenibacillus sp. J2TS4]GIP34777.1 anion permease [Paenibacillus sp. J2TS4]